MQEVIEEAVVPDLPGRIRPLWAVPERLERGQHARGGVGARHVAAIGADADRGEAEAGGRDAAWRPGRAAIADQPVHGIGLVPEVAEPRRHEAVLDGGLTD